STWVCACGATAPSSSGGSGRSLRSRWACSLLLVMLTPFGEIGSSHIGPSLVTGRGAGRSQGGQPGDEVVRALRVCQGFTDVLTGEGQGLAQGDPDERAVR